MKCYLPYQVLEILSHCVSFDFQVTHAPPSFHIFDSALVHLGSTADRAQTEGSWIKGPI